MNSLNPESIVLESVSPVRQSDDRDHGLPLESHRAYLKSMANARISRTIQAYVSPSDMVQSVFASAYRMMTEPGRPAIRNSKNWLTGILKNKIRIALRKYRRREHNLTNSGPVDSAAQDLPSYGTGVCPEQVIDESDTFAWVMAKLPANQRQVVELYLLHQMEMAEIAKLLGITVSCANQRYQRARQFLQERIDPSEYR